MKTSDNVRKLNLLFIFTFPILGFISFIRSGNVERYYWSLLFFFVSYGLLFVLPNDGDAFRHYGSFLSYSEKSFSEVSSEIIDVLLFNSKSNSDIYILLSNYIVSRIGSSSAIYFGFHALIYSLIYFSSIQLILKGTKVHKNLLTSIFFLLIVFIAPIAKIQYVRYFLATWFFLYATIGYLRTFKKGYLLYGLIASIVHFSFVFPIILFLFYTFTKRYIVLWFVIAGLSIYTSNFLNQYTDTVLNYSGLYFKNSSIDQKSKAYLGNEEYIEYRENRFENRAWYANPSLYLNLAYTILLFLIGILYLLKKIRIDNLLKVLLTFSLFLFSLTELGKSFASVGERFQQVFFVGFSVFLLHYFNYPRSNKIIKWVAYCFVPFYLIFLAMALREMFFTGDIFVFIGNPFVALFVERSSLLSHLIP